VYQAKLTRAVLYTAHPLHFLYTKFHADIAPIGGHDGHADPGGDAAFHWLHHAKFECNYGVPLVDFDRLFGTWVDYEDYLREGSLKAAKEKSSSGKSKRAKAK
jgi:sterol desaturase/sphingolipid hydroxylase (fatty acid hydroxylase superfamily)